MNICRLASLRIGLDEWLDLIEGPAGGMPHSLERFSSLNRGLINTSEAVAHIIRCTQYPCFHYLICKGEIKAENPNALTKCH